MTQEEFKKYIEHPIDKWRMADIKNGKEAIIAFWRSATIARTIRLTLKHPNLAKEYLDGLPKATMD